MHLKVMLVGGKIIMVNRFSRCMQVIDLRQRIANNLDVSEDRIRLFFGGKQLENGFSVFDYDVDVHSTVQCMIKPEPDIGNVQKKKENINKTTKKGKVSPKKKDDSVQKSSPKKSRKKDDNKDWAEPSTSRQESQPGPTFVCTYSAQIDSEDSTDSEGDTGNESIQRPIENIESLQESIQRPIENIESLQVGDIVEMIDDIEGAWFTVILRNMYFDKDAKDYVFIGEYKGFHSKNTKKVDITEISVTKENIRFPIKKRVQLKDVKLGDTVKVIYSLDGASKKGLWFDCVVRSVSLGARWQLKGDIIHGRKKIIKKNCVILSTENIFRVSSSGNSEKQHIECEHCMDRPSRKCKECACRVCGSKDEPGKQILCDECDYAYHIWCLTPKLQSVPDTDDWYCPDCKNDENEIIKAGDKPSISKRKSKMMSYKDPSSESETKGRDWGQGMACVGRKKHCTIVPPNHFGPIPGVEVGSSWRYRVQVAEAGVHRPHVSGIHGRQDEGAYSIVLSGGYEDDKDDGDTFMYTGCGGRDLSGNKRTSVQCSDQKLENLNLALARNCNTPINKEIGATAKDWRKGKPVRVIRNYKAIKHSKYAPKEGNRYDGIYKVVKYFPMKGKSGFIVWRYKLQRDDPVPAPWTKAGKERIESLGLEMQVPEGYEDKLKAMQDKEQSTGKHPKENGKKSVDRGKRSVKQSVLKLLCDSSPSPTKKAKIKYEIEKEVAILIKKDVENAKLWKMCKGAIEQGKQQFLKDVQTVFHCICCQELVFKPVTTSCKHNFCKVCVDRSVAADVKTCPHCRCDLSSEKFKVNENLENILLTLFPGYTVGR